MKKAFALIFIACPVYVYADPSGQYCESNVSQCKEGNIIVVSGDDIARNCDFSKAIVPIRTVHNKPGKDGSSVSVNIVACFYSGNK